MFFSSRTQESKFSLTLKATCFSASPQHSNYFREINFVSQVLGLIFGWVWFSLSTGENCQARASGLHCGLFKHLIFLDHLLTPPLAFPFWEPAGRNVREDRHWLGCFKLIPTWAMETTAISLNQWPNSN